MKVDNPDEKISAALLHPSPPQLWNRIQQANPEAKVGFEVNRRQESFQETTVNLVIAFD